MIIISIRDKARQDKMKKCYRLKKKLGGKKEEKNNSDYLKFFVIFQLTLKLLWKIFNKSTLVKKKHLIILVMDHAVFLGKLPECIAKKWIIVERCFIGVWSQEVEQQDTSTDLESVSSLLYLALQHMASLVLTK